ncbi:visual pigment-like receptor peropsin [Pomacea canaliculata]|uniref:visual pigment-like receptor peropsin n=1 Tax=Pomacea canaliculata TaxID=400727 RepID=UPI000D739D18|nr:visual pigment-like receptor peropsin [Pomacea canaliculata]
MATDSMEQMCASSPSEFTRFEHATVGALYMIFGVGGVVTNLLIILAFFKDKALLRGSTSWLHVSLAFANICVVAPAPFPASSSFSGRWLYGDKVCQAYAFEGMFVGIAAIGAVFSLCVERYLVSKREDAMQQNPAAFYWVATVINISNALFWSVMPLLGWSRYSVDHTGAACAIDWKSGDESYASYMTMLCFFPFALPFAFAIACLYASIPKAPALTSASGSLPQASGQPARDHTTSSFTEGQLRWLCLCFLVLVLVGWGPFAWLCLWAMVGDTAGVSMLAATIPPLACKFTTMMYPLTYNVINPRFRAAYFSILGTSATEETVKVD